MSLINCTGAHAVAFAESCVSKWGDRQWLYDAPFLPELKDRPHSEYWCLDFVRYVLIKAGAWDLHKIVSLDAFVPSAYAAFAAAPASQFRTVSHTEAQAGDVIIYQIGASYYYHIEMIRAETNGDTGYTIGGDTSSLKFPGSSSKGGCFATHAISWAHANSNGHSFRIWRPGYDAPKPAPHVSLAVDGSFGPHTQARFIQATGKTTMTDAVRWLQWECNTKGFRGLDGYSTLILDGQGIYSNTVHDTPRTNTCCALQRALGVTHDGFFSARDSSAVRKLQENLNAGKVI